MLYNELQNTKTEADLKEVYIRNLNLKLPTRLNHTHVGEYLIHYYSNKFPEYNVIELNRAVEFFEGKTLYLNHSKDTIPKAVAEMGFRIEKIKPARHTTISVFTHVGEYLIYFCNNLLPSHDKQELQRAVDYFRSKTLKIQEDETIADAVVKLGFYIGGKKYELLKDDFLESESGIKMYRIKSLKDFRHIRAGELGGYIESEHNLSHFNNCWVEEYEKVSGDYVVKGSYTRSRIIKVSRD